MKLEIIVTTCKRKCKLSITEDFESTLRAKFWKLRDSLESDYTPFSRNQLNGEQPRRSAFWLVSRFREFTLEKLVISTSGRVKSVRVNGLSQSVPTPLDLAARKSDEGTIEAGRVAAARCGLFPLAAMRQPRQVSQVEPVCKRTCVRSCVQGERLDERRALSRIDRRRLFRGQVVEDRPRSERSFA